MKFKAAILVECKKPLVIDFIENNKLKSGQVLIKILKSGICRSQIFEIQGNRGEDKWLPHLLGHEALGIVEDFGEGVSKVKKGDLVILTWIKSKGISAEPAKYKWNGKVVNSGRVTTFSEYSVCSEDRIVKTEGSNYELIGPSLGCALPTGFGIPLKADETKKAKYIGVLGLGGIGMSALMSATINSNAKVIGIDTNYLRIIEAKSIFENALFINSMNEDPFITISKYTNGHMLDLLVESSGSIKALNLSINLINNYGIVKFASHPKHGELLKIDPFELIKGKRIEGSWGGGINPDKDFSKIVDQIKDKQKFIDLFQERDYVLEDINIAIEEMQNGTLLRPIIKMI